MTKNSTKKRYVEKRGDHFSVQFTLPNGKRTKRVILHPETGEPVTTKAAAQQWAYHTIETYSEKPENNTTTLQGIDALYQKAYAHTWSSKRLKEHTAYVRRWSAFFKTVSAINSASLGEYETMRLQTVKASSVNRELNEMRSLIRWAVNEPDIPIHRNPFTNRPKLKEKNRQRRILTNWERFKFLRKLYQNVSSKRKNPREYESAVKLRMMCLLWLYTGMRRTETLSIRLSDIELVEVPAGAASGSQHSNPHGNPHSNPHGKPHGIKSPLQAALIYLPETKTGEERKITVSPMVTRRLLEYLDFHEKHFIDKRSRFSPDQTPPRRSEWLFPNDRDRSRHMVDPKTVFHSLREQCGLQDIVIHSFRHSFADRTLNDDGTDVAFAIGMAQLGHKRAETTMIYLRDNDNRKVAAFASQGSLVRVKNASRK